MTRTTLTATLTGLLDLAKPDPAQITIEDIALKLAGTNRWGKVLFPQLTVAQHSIMVANQLPPHLRIYGLLHDAHEAFLGDITTPVENLFTNWVPGFGAHLSNAKHALDVAIRLAFGVPEPSIDARAIVHNADLVMAATEWWSLMPEACGKSPILAEPIRSMRIKPPIFADAIGDFTEALELELAVRGWEVSP